MHDPNKLIEIARSIDPELSDPEQSLVEALLVLKAMAILGQPVIPTEIPEPYKVPKQSAQVPSEHLGLQLKRFLKKKKLKTSAVARLLEVSVSSIHGWMTGKWTPSEKYQTRIVKLMEEGYAAETDQEDSQD